MIIISINGKKDCYQIFDTFHKVVVMDNVNGLCNAEKELHKLTRET